MKQTSPEEKANAEYCQLLFQSELSNLVANKELSSQIFYNLLEGIKDPKVKLANGEYMDLYFVDDEGLYFAEDQNSDDKAFNVVIEKNLAINYLEEFVKTRKGVVKFEYKGKEFRVIKDDNMPMAAYLEGIIDRLKD